MSDFTRKRFTRKEILDSLYDKIGRKEPIILGGAGIGLVAKVAEKAGIDLIMAYNTGYFRMDGYPSICGNSAWADANTVTRELAERILKVVHHTPVIAGVGAHDPRRDIPFFIDELMRLGVSGITNVPGMGHHHGMMYRKNMDDCGMGYNLECEMIRYCNQRDIFTVAYAYTLDDVKAMTASGVDVLGAHIGDTSGGMVGVKAGVLDMDQACELTQKMYETAKKENPNVIVVAHGGPIETPQDLAIILERTDVKGFIGASSIERLPVERAVYDEIKRFTAIKTARRLGME